MVDCQFESTCLVPAADWAVRWCRLDLHTELPYHRDGKDRFVYKGKLITSDVCDVIFKREFARKFYKTYSGVQAHCAATVAAIVAAYVAGMITMVVVCKLLPTKEAFAAFSEKFMYGLGKGLGDSKTFEGAKGQIADIIDETKEVVIDKYTNLLKIVEVAAVAVCFFNLAPLCRTYVHWASLLGLVLAQGFGQSIYVKFLGLFSPSAEAHADSAGVEPFVTVFFTLLTVLLTGKISTSLVTNFFRISDLTGCKDLFKNGAGSAISTISDLFVSFLRFLATHRSSAAVNEILVRSDILHAQKEAIRSVPTLLIEMQQAILSCGQMSADPTLYRSLDRFQDLVVQAHGVMNVLAVVRGYPFAERVHFSAQYMKLYEAVYAAVNTRNALNRVEPTVIYLSGPAGILKTTVAEVIAKKVAQRLWPDELRSGQYKYDRNPLQKHWDRYCNQPICKIEEAFCAVKPKAGTEDEEHKSWLALISSSTYPVPMASISDKKTVFTSEVIICTSNTAFPETNVNREALLRRMQNHVLFCWQTGFPNNVLSDTNTGAMSDLSHLVMYAHDPSRALPVPSGAVVQNFPGGRIHPVTVEEFNNWTLLAEDNGVQHQIPNVAAGVNVVNQRAFRDEYSVVTVDQLVDRVVNSVLRKRAHANIGAEAHGSDDDTTPKVVLVPTTSTTFVEHRLMIRPPRPTLSNDSIKDIRCLTDLMNFDTETLRRMHARSFASTQALFRVWAERQVPLDFPLEEASDQDLLEAVMNLVVDYRVFRNSITTNSDTHRTQARLGARGWSFTTNIFGQTIATGPNQFNSVISFALSDLKFVHFTHHLDPQDFEDLCYYARCVDVELSGECWSFVKGLLASFITAFIFGLIFKVFVSAISAIVGSILRLCLGGPRGSVETCALADIDLMFARRDALGLEKHASEDGHGYFDKHGKQYHWDQDSRDWKQMESTCSGGNKKKETQSASNRKLRGAARAHAVDWLDDLSEIEADTSLASHKLLDTFASQCVKITYMGDDRMLTMYGVQIDGNRVLVPKHLIAQQKRSYYTFRVQTDCGSLSFKESVPASKLTFFSGVKGVSGFNLEMADGMLIEFQNLKIQKSLVKHVAHNVLSFGGVFGMLRKVEAVALIPRIDDSLEGENRCTLAVPCGHVTTMGNVQYKDGAYAEYRADLYKTTIPELGHGDCGSILIVREDGQYRIAGIYVAGDSTKGVSYFQPITKSLIEQLVENAHCHGFVEYPPHDLDVPLSRSITNQCPALGRYSFADKPGVCSIPPSEIFPSPLQKEKPHLFGHPVLTAPAKLNKLSMQKAVDKKWHVPGFFDTTFLEAAGDWVKQDLAAFIKPCSRNSLQDSMDGITHYGESSKLAMDTSPGLPWTFQKKAGSPGKTDFFDFVDGRYVPKREVVSAVEGVIEGRERGLIKPGLFRGTLKDERRDIERVLDSKTRIFTAGSMEKVIADRMLFLDFVVQFKANRLEMQHAYGVDPESTEWNDMIQKHLAIGKKHFGFDYSGFDASESLMLLQMVSECIATCFVEEDRKHVVCSGLESFNHFVVIDGDLYHYHQGNPSGCTMTTVYNTIANWILLYYAWIKLAATNNCPLTRGFYKENCVVHAYGDDFICTVSDQCSWFNGETIPPILEVCGVKATAPDKSECKKFLPLEDLTFLTRSFVRNTMGGSELLFVGPLPKWLLEEIPMWLHKGAEDNDFLSTVRTAVRGAAFWGRSYFSWFLSCLRDSDTGRKFLDLLDTEAIYCQASRPFVCGKSRVIERERVCFNWRSKEYSRLSNMYECPVMYKKIQFRSAEAAYQCAKAFFCDDSEPLRFEDMTALEAQRSGKRIVVNSAWNNSRVKVMEEILQSKFSNPEMLDALRSTGDAVLIEWTPNKFWGSGLRIDTDPRVQSDIPGENYLGRLLMDVRRKFCV